jgi:ATP-dependent DNA helicase DinG
LRQGVGRLIRTKTDRGIVVILDNRIVTRPYGRAFMPALPKCPVEIV